MSAELAVALQITLVGMGIVFAAILLLWAMMAALVRLTTPLGVQSSPESGPEVMTAAEPDGDAAIAADAAISQTDETAAASGEAAAELERKRRAAAIAVAVALAQQNDKDTPHEFPLPQTPLVTAWQAVTRTRLLSRHRPTR